MLKSWLFFEVLALIAALFGFGATATAAHDLAKLSFYTGPFYDLARLFF